IGKAILLFLQDELPRIVYEHMIPYWKEIIENIRSFIAYCHRIEQLYSEYDREYKIYEKKREKWNRGFHTQYFEEAVPKPLPVHARVYEDLKQQTEIIQQVVGNWLEKTRDDEHLYWFVQYIDRGKIQYAIREAQEEIKRFEGYLAHPSLCIQ